MMNSYAFLLIGYYILTAAGCFYFYDFYRTADHASGKNPFTQWRIIILLIAVVFQTIGMGMRWYEAGHPPFANMYESLLFLGFVISLEYCMIDIWKPAKSLGVIVIPISWLVFGYALNAFPWKQVFEGANYLFKLAGSGFFFPVPNRGIEPLMPALKSYWIQLHVPVVFFSYGAFAMAFGSSLLYLVRDYKNKKHPTEVNHSRQDDLENLDQQTYWYISIGFILLGIGIITGALWAHEAWSRYWSWDPKEVWSLIVWLIYAVYLHMRLISGWKGTKTAWFGVIGFIMVFLCYYGVNVAFELLFKTSQGLHSYGAPPSNP